MSINVYDVAFRDENHELKSEEDILIQYFNKLVNDCRKDTKGKTYEELESTSEEYSMFTDKLGFFEEEIDYTISDMLSEITYKKHRDILKDLKEKKCLYEWDFSETPIDDLNSYVKVLRKKLKTVIKIYKEHEFKNNNIIGLIRGYSYYKSY